MKRSDLLEQFSTPEELAERMASIAMLGTHDIVLEPSAGTGRLVQAAYMRDAAVIAVEVDQDICEELEAMFAPSQVKVEVADFMLWRNRHLTPTAVLMHPPFALNQDIRHVRRAWDMLGKGGRLVAVMSQKASYSYEPEIVEFRRWAISIGAGMIPLPEDMFEESGSDQPTVLFHAANKQTEPC